MKSKQLLLFFPWNKTTHHDVLGPWKAHVAGKIFAAAPLKKTHRMQTWARWILKIQHAAQSSGLLEPLRSPCDPLSWFSGSMLATWDWWQHGMKLSTEEFDGCRDELWLPCLGGWVSRGIPAEFCLLWQQKSPPRANHFRSSNFPLLFFSHSHFWDVLRGRQSLKIALEGGGSQKGA